MTKRIFIWVAHPKTNTYCGALADAYQMEAEAQGANVHRMNLNEMHFDMEKAGFSRSGAELEPDLKAWQEQITQADHLLFIHPYWWGAMPAKAKAVLDRALTPGFGFKYHKRGISWDKLLKGKTADVIITSDTPTLIDTFLYGRPARRVMKNQVLGYCGIKTKKIVQFGSVKMASQNKILKWIDRAKTMGRKAAA